VAEGAGLLNRYTDLNPYRGFESLSLRHYLPGPFRMPIFPVLKKLPLKKPLCEIIHMKNFVFTTKSAFVLGLALQTGYAMEDEIIDIALSQVMETVSKNIQMAAQIVDNLDYSGQLNLNRNRLPIMRSGTSSIHQEYEDRRKDTVKLALTLELTKQGVIFEQQRTFANLDSNDQALVQALRNHTW
jgi:hypothetical protein